MLWLIITVDEHRGAWLELCGEHYHRLVRVRRVRAGDALSAMLPDGRVLRAEITEIGADTVRARVLAEEPPTGVSSCRLVLYQAVLKGEKMDFVVQKACELGVHALVPLLARRSIPRWTPAQAVERVSRWQRIAEAACEQCERSVPMRVETPRNPEQAAAGQPDFTLLLHERRGESPRALAASKPHVLEIGLYLGPEGGWDDEETERLLAAGAVPIHLGPRILRAETASLAAITLVQHLWGDLR